jgi:NADP-dependent 3-hydroxy acid dehydrogenase YdfG
MDGTPLEGRVAAITGASSGIGAATARALARAGAAVAVGARRNDRLEELVDEIEGNGGRAVALSVDVADEDAARRFATETNEQLGRLDILVNNAGVMLLGPVEGADTEEWRRMIDANVYGVLYCTHAALPIMREQGGGHIVNVSSVAGRVAGANTAVYNLTKFGVTAFSEALRQEALNSRVRVTVVEPGFVETELQSHNSEQVQQGISSAMEKIGDVLQAEDIAEAILYAVSQPERVGINEVLVRPLGQK